jgi:integrase
MQAIAVSTMTVQEIAQLANQYAASNVFADHQERLAANTKKRHLSDLKIFSLFLSQVGIVLAAEELLNDPSSWQHITHGLLTTFVKWLLQDGYSIGTVNLRLSTVRSYAKLATKAGAIPTEEYALIRMVQGYSVNEGRHVDETRSQTRKGTKKAVPTAIHSPEQFKAQSDSDQGKRDALLMCLLLDMGFRCNEIAMLPANCIDLSKGTITFFRSKVGKTQTHKLSPDTYEAAKRYLALEAVKEAEYLIMGSRKSGKLEGHMSDRAINKRVKELGQKADIQALSPHDFRHEWVTSKIREGRNLKQIEQAGGWNSPAMVFRYAAETQIANEGLW